MLREWKQFKQAFIISPLKMHKKAIDLFVNFLNARWAFGVVLWELVTLGKYVSVGVDVLKFVQA